MMNYSVCAILFVYFCWYKLVLIYPATGTYGVKQNKLINNQRGHVQYDIQMWETSTETVVY